MTEFTVKDATVAGSHPCTRGHFPGLPVVPGAFLLSLVDQLIADDFPGQRLTSLRKVKFLQPLTPGVHTALRYATAEGGKVRFELVSEARVILEGSGLLSQQ